MKLEKVSVSFDEKKVLKRIDFSWNQGETIAIIGANGAGKTTLMKVVCQLIKPSEGKLIIPGEIKKDWKRKLGIVFPESFLYQDLTAVENLIFYQSLYGHKDVKRVRQLLSEVQLSHVENESVSTFSKGMKQRLSIARALIHEPTYLLLDEPFDGLDLRSQAIIANLLHQQKQAGVGWLLINHNVEQAWDLCDEVLLMDHGQVISKERCTKTGYAPFLLRYTDLLKGKEYGIF